MRVLVTGGTGFIGSNLTLRLLSDGHDIVITGHDAEQPVPEGVRCLQPGLLGIRWDDIGRVDVLFHQAAINNTTLLDEREMMYANVEAARTLFEYVVRAGCRRIVYATSTAVYGDLPAPYRESGGVKPLNPYASSKVELESLARKLALEHPPVTLVGLRYCNVYGPRENHKGARASMIWQLARQMRNGNPRIFKYGEQKRDYIYVDDVVQANLCAAEARQSCVVNCGFGTATSFTDLVKSLNTTLQLNRQPEYIENPYAERYQSHTECDMSLAKELLGFVPQTGVPEGLERYLASGFL